MLTMPASLPLYHVLVLAFSMLCSTGGVNGCSVAPSFAAVVAGDDLSLTCTTQGKSERILTWRLDSDSNSALALYEAAYYDSDGSIIIEKKVVDGYLVNDSNPNIKAILTIVDASTDQANYYFCLCTGSLSSSAYVSVLVSEPTFSNGREVTDREPVIFTCSVSFNGSASTSISIEDSSGNSLNARNYDGTAKGLQSFGLNYSVIADSRVYQEYFCNIKLSSDRSNIIYSRKLNASVQWASVRNVQINPIDRTQCLGGRECTVNQTINCTAEGNPKPVTFQWMTSRNGSGFIMTETSNDEFTFTTTGRYEVQCIAFNEITGIIYNSSSRLFTTQVTMETLNYPTAGAQKSASNNTPLIVGLVVGLGGGLIVIIVSVIVILIFWKRKKRGTVCCNPDGSDTGNNQSVELHNSHSDTNSTSTDKGGKKNGHITPGVLIKGSDEVTVVDNTLYSGAQKPKQIDPSDGGYASINEVMPHGK